MAKTVDKLKEIIRLDTELNKVQDLDILLERILLEARRATNAEAGSIYVLVNDKLSIKYSQTNQLFPNSTKQDLSRIGISLNS